LKTNGLKIVSAIIFGIIQATLIVLRVMGVIDSWFMAYLPLVLLFSFFIFLIVLVFYVIYKYEKETLIYDKVHKEFEEIIESIKKKQEEKEND
jgi:hypothetical protein